MKRLLLTFVINVFAVFGNLYAQQYCGINGLIHVPTADMDTVGIARIGAHYVPKVMMPDKMLIDGEKFNSLTNYLSITPFRWIEVGYGYTLWKFHQDLDPNKKVGFYAKDRYFSLKLQPIKEDKWWPSVAIGGNDVWGSGDDGESGSNYYRNYFVALSKHTDLGRFRLGGHLAYRSWKRDFNHRWNGIVGGVTLQHSFYEPLRGIAEWDGNAINVGADCLLFNIVLVQCGLYDMKYFTGGISLYFHLL
jgi:hypothetical protein